MLKVKIRTLTPLWTGDIDRECKSIKETGIIGSLRWWYEALVRGLGAYACDPTSEGICSYKESINEICHACRIFGCTGLSKKFKIEANGLKCEDIFFVTSQNTNRRWLNKIFENQNFSLEGNGKISVLGFQKEIEEIISFLIWYTTEYGGIGAKTQNGFGQTLVTNLDMKSVKEGFKQIKNMTEEDARRVENPLWNCITNLFSLKFKIPENNEIVEYYLNKAKIVKNAPEDWKGRYIPCSFDIRYQGVINNKNFGLRNYFRDKIENTLADKLFGFSRGKNRAGSKIFVSHLYKEEKKEDFYYLKVWGFIPESILSKTSFETLEDFKEEVRGQIEYIFGNIQTVSDKIGEKTLKGVL